MHTQIQTIALAKLQFSGTNPRSIIPYEVIDDSANQEVDNELLGLADSIKAHGLIQPLTVRKIPRKDEFEIIAGHRRANAARLAGLEEVPCSVVELKGSAVALQLIENLQRQDLTPYETATGIQQLLTAKVKQKDIAAELGKSEAWVSKLVTIAKAIKKQTSEESQRILMGFTDTDKLYQQAREILGLDVKEAKKSKAEADADPSKDQQLDALDDVALKIEEYIADKYKLPVDAVKFSIGKYNSATIEISFLTMEGFNAAFMN